MLNEKIRNLRNTKSMSQEDLARNLHVTRQTISKWEHALSVPDADILMKMADLFGVSVSYLLDSQLETNEEVSEISEKLETLNRLLAERNRRTKNIWRVVGIILVGWLLFTVLMLILSLVSFESYQSPSISSQEANEIYLDDKE